MLLSFCLYKALFFIPQSIFCCFSNGFSLYVWIRGTKGEEIVEKLMSIANGQVGFIYIGDKKYFELDQT